MSPKPQQKSQSKPPNRRALLARADVRFYQCLVIDSQYKKRNILVYHCGDDIFYSASMDGLFDPARRRPAPGWLKQQLLKPEPYTVLLTHRTNERYPEGPAETEISAVKQPRGSDDLDLDEDGVQQG